MIATAAERSPVPALDYAEIEADLVGAVLSVPLLYKRLAKIVSGDDFSDAKLGLLFKLVGPMIRANIIITADDEVAWWLSESPEWESADEEEIRAFVDRLQRRTVDSGPDLTRYVSYLAEAISRRKSGEIYTTSEVKILTVGDVIKSESFARPRRTYATGIPQLDQILGGGFKSGQQSVIGAPTGVGKTSLVGSISLFLARSGHPVLWVATELSAEEQAARFAAIALREQGANHTADELLSHAVPVSRIASAMADLPVYVVRVRRRDGDPFAIISKHAAAIRDIRGQAPIIVCDYLQKLAVSDEDNRRVSVSAVSEQLLDIAQASDTHVIAISSVARAFYNSTARKLRKQRTEQEDPRDWLAMGKESGEIEYDGAVIAYLDVADNATMLDERLARLVISKNRNGLVGFVGLKFHGPSGLFVPAAEAASALAPTVKNDAFAAAQTKQKIRRAVLRRKRPFTSRNQIADALGGRRADVLGALDDMFETGELSQDKKGAPLLLISDEETTNE